MKQTTFAALGIVLLVFSACAREEGPERKPTFPVKGVVYVDGKPASGLAIEVHNVLGFDTEHPTISSALTKEDGTFELGTYESNDGVPSGGYRLCFTWREMNLISMSYGGKDKLNDRYNTIEKSPVKFTIQDQPLDLGRIDLKTTN